jgi:hypothetical protein
MSEHDLVEYYLVDDPPGFLMLKSNGEIWRVGILNEAELADQARRARDAGAPAEVAARLEAGDAILFSAGLSAADYFGEEGLPWLEHVHPATVLRGERDVWRVAIWKNAPADIDFDPETASYDAYLASL